MALIKGVGEGETRGRIHGGTASVGKGGRIYSHTHTEAHRIRHVAVHAD